jgi:vacuolar protein sorting-associated protein 29
MNKIYNIHRIGVVHGHQILPWGDHLSLATMRRKLNVDVLISGHTHKNEVVEHDGHYHINPGSITGAFSECSTNDVSPSFILLAVQGPKVICYVYELIDGEVEVFKTEFSK